MKTKFTIVTLCLLFVLSLSLQAQNQITQNGKKYFQNTGKISLEQGIHSSHFALPKSVAGQISVPGYSEDYSWDPDANDWLHVSNTTYSYDDAGRITEEIEQEAQTDIYLSRNSYSYDYFGNIIEDVNYTRGVEEWIPAGGSKSEYLLNVNGEVVGVIGKIIMDGEWINKTKTEYILNANAVPIGMQTYNWTGTDWELYGKTVNITWHNWQKRQIAGYTFQYLQDGFWTNGERYFAQYNGNSYIGEFETWQNTQWEYTKREVYSKTVNEEILTLGSWNGAGWVMEERYTTKYDGRGNQTKMEFATWSPFEWLIELEFFFDLTYNESIDVTELVIRYRDPDITEPANISKLVFSSFLHFETTGVENVNVLENVEVYPNPVTSVFNIKINDKSATEFAVNIVNLAGQTIFSGNYSTPSISVNTELLPGGMYLLNIKSSEGKIYNSKFMKK